MPRRFHITINAKTSAGGIVTTGSHFASTNGLQLALEGDVIECPACHSRGRIKCDGPRISSTYNGKQSALSDDLCICDCDPPPKLVAIQENLYQVVGDAPREDWATANHFATAATSGATHDLAFEVKDESGQALAGYPYLIELPNGNRLEGLLDQNGMTRKVGANDAQLANLTIYAPAPTPVSPDWDR